VRRVRVWGEEGTVLDQCLLTDRGGDQRGKKVKKVVLDFPNR